MSENLSSNPEEKSEKTCDNPREFIDHFTDSHYYKEAYNHLFKGKRLAPDVTEEEKKEVFWKSDDAKEALIRYAEEEEHFTYNPNQFSTAVQFAARTYIKSTEDFFKLYREGMDRETIRNLDSLRYSYHQTLAEQLFKDGYAPSIKIGRGLARLILIDKGLDTYDNAAIRDSDRLSYLLIGNERY